MKRTLLRASRRFLSTSSSSSTTLTLRTASTPFRTTTHPPSSSIPRRQITTTTTTTTTTTPPNNPSKEPTIDPPHTPTHYDLFPSTLPLGPPPSGPFDIDLRALRAEFLRLQAKTHPDLHPPAAKPRAEAASALINEAYKTLQDPLLRAQYLLSLQGIDMAGDEAGKVEDQELLMDVMEAQEAIEEARSEGDLEGVRVRNARDVERSVAVLGEAFASGDWEAARRESVRLRYWVNIGEGVRDWEPGREVRLVH